jgi:hypothetical protein
MSPALPLVLLLLVVASGPAHPTSPDAGENLFRGPARCVLGYLEAVRLAGPRGRALPRGASRALEQSYRAARALTAPRALQEADRQVARGQGSPLAPWRDAAAGAVLESFSLLEVRRAPLGAAVVVVRERIRRDGEPSLGLSWSEYLVARVGGDWKVVDRRVSERFQDREISEQYSGWFDAPQVASQRPER